MDKYRTFGRRVGASILDSIIIVPVNWFVAFVMMTINGVPTMLSWALPSFITASYYILMHYFWGQTIGKMAAQVKVLGDFETPINLGQSIARSLPQLILPMFAISFSTAGDVYTIGDWAGMIYLMTFAFSFFTAIVCLVSSKHRALHDFIAGTVVVRTDI